MNLVADESVDAPIVRYLREDGYQVWYILEIAPGMADEDILSLANRLEAPLLTADKDFGELVFNRRQVTRGVILIRLSGLTMESKISVVEQAFTKHAMSLANAFTVITPKHIRIRPIP
jgi:predicted nuclease of predicted toxin-antitoxin system